MDKYVLDKRETDLEADIIRSADLREELFLKSCEALYSELTVKPCKRRLELSDFISSRQ